MPWGVVTVVSQRQQFVELAGVPGANIRGLCRQFGVSPKTGYKWLHRFAEAGKDGLGDRSRRPRASPGQTAPAMEERVLCLRERYPDWGGRKLRAVLLREGVEGVPSASTITAILRRHGRLDGPGAGEPRGWLRFEHEAPNDLWQMDFKGHFPLNDGAGRRCHPLTVLDDHSRFSVCLRACADEREKTVQDALRDAFRRYGLPRRMSADNGPPWGNGYSDGLTWLGGWLVRLGIRLGHSRPYHPQTQGKDERFHRTLKLELLARNQFSSLADAQRAFEDWRERYNGFRPHEALALSPPISRFAPSIRPFPEVLPPIEYEPGDQVRKVQQNGVIHFKGKEYLVSRGLTGEPVAVRPMEEDGCWEVYYCRQRVREIVLD